MFCPIELKYKSLRNKDFDKFVNRMLLFTKTQRNLKRTIYNSNQVLSEKFFEGILHESIIKDICDDYLKFKYFLGSAELRQGRPDYLSSGYKYFYRDRQHLNSLHFDINLIDMFESSGAVEVINKNLSKKVK